VNFSALDDKVILKLEAVDEVTASGLFIPDGATEIPNQGTVVAVGPEAYDISVGDVVIFNKRGGQMINIDEEDYLVFLAEHILAIIKD